MGEVKSRMKIEIVLRKFLVDVGKVKKILDFVRYNVQIVKQIGSMELLDEFDEFNFLIIFLGGRREWNSNDV